MPPRRTSQSGYRGVRPRANGTFYAEIRSDDSRVPLGTYTTAAEAARAYDAAAWRLNRSRRSMNFQDCRNTQEAANRAPPPRLVTVDDRREHRLRATLRLVEDWDQRVVDDWYRNHPREAREEMDFKNTQAAERAERREDREARRVVKARAEAELLAGQANWPEDDERWNALQDDISDDTNSEDDIFSSDDEF